ncbi:hypothetical protein AB0I61_26085 [Polymorphospora rubra]|uniref:hypothetical protein n=1 Tax=Polymorphospora rubra TaxID=338584 RepID=UPI0033EC0F79
MGWQRSGPGRSRRRELLRDGVLLAFGAGVGAAGFAEAADVTDRKLPIRGGAASAAMTSQPDPQGNGELRLTWCVDTDRRAVALTLVAAARMRYRIVLWSLQMQETRYRGDPAGHARHIAGSVRPGTIILAHDVGNTDRLVALRGLPDMIDQLRAQRFDFVTVSDLLRLHQNR